MIKLIIGGRTIYLTKNFQLRGVLSKTTAKKTIKKEACAHVFNALPRSSGVSSNAKAGNISVKSLFVRNSKENVITIKAPQYIIKFLKPVKYCFISKLKNYGRNCK